MTAIAVPEWYRIDKNNGDSESVLKQKVRKFCQEALAHRAAPGEIVDDALVDITYEMYEYALQANG